MEEGCHWEVTRVKQKVNNGKYADETVHGKAWGIFTWNGRLPVLAWLAWVSQHLTHCTILLVLLLQARLTVRNTRCEEPTRRCGST